MFGNRCTTFSLNFPNAIGCLCLTLTHKVIRHSIENLQFILFKIDAGTFYNGYDSDVQCQMYRRKKNIEHDWTSQNGVTCRVKWHIVVDIYRCTFQTFEYNKFNYRLQWENKLQNQMQIRANATLFFLMLFDVARETRPVLLLFYFSRLIEKWKRLPKIGRCVRMICAR